MSEWQQLFADRAASTAFHLTLSRPMVGIIWDIKLGRAFWCSTTGHHMLTMSALRTRGLIHQPEPLGNWELSPAGDLVWSLLDLAGIQGSVVNNENQRRAE